MVKLKKSNNSRSTIIILRFNHFEKSPNPVHLSHLNSYNIHN
jgi:hypothetical protein